MTRQANKGNEKFALIRTIGIAFGAIGGTTFSGANLTGANFTGATLKSTRFIDSKQPTNLTQVCWKDAQKLDRARLGEAIVSNAAVRELLVTRNGYKKSYVDAKLRGANLNGINLNEANLKWADLSEATLQDADLRGANLKEVLATGTDFSGACLTGACLEGWNIDHTTKLDRVDCQYVFLLEQPNKIGSRERRPHDPEAVFAPGDFEKLYQKIMNTVQILLRNGINGEAFAAAFQKLISENPELSLDAIRAIEKKGDDVLLTLEVPETADKAKLAQSFQKPYEDYVRQLEAKVDRLNELRSADIKDVALMLARPVNVNQNQIVGERNTVQETNDSSRNISIGNIGGDFNASGQALNLGEISGTVTNTISDLQNVDRPEAAQLAQILKQLQTEIEASDLPDGDKTEALEQVGTIAKAGQNPQDGTLKKLSATALKILQGTIASLPDTAKLVDACSKLLPLIKPLIGLP